MIISNRLFILQGPIRVDLYGRPFGMLFIWRPKFNGPYHPASGRDFSFKLNQKPKVRPNVQDFAATIYVNSPSPHDIKQWPEDKQKIMASVVQRKLADLPAGSVVVSSQSFCDRRGDMPGKPWQLYHEISVETPRQHDARQAA